MKSSSGAMGIEALSKLAVAAATGIYVVGLVVVSLHLARYGVSGTGLLKAQYILAGSWAMLPIVAVLTLVALSAFGVIDELRSQPTDLPREATQGRSDDSKLRRLALQGWRLCRIFFKILWTAATVAAGWLLLFAFILSFVTDHFPVLSAGWSFLEGLLVGVQTLAFVFVIALFGFGAWWVLRSPPSIVNIGVGGVCAVVALASAVGYVGFFTFRIYPQISAVVGGGHAVPVQFVFVKDAASLPGGVAHTGTFALLFENERSYFIQHPSDGKQAIEIPRNLVAFTTTTGRGTGPSDNAKR